MVALPSAVSPEMQYFLGFTLSYLVEAIPIVSIWPVQTIDFTSQVSIPMWVFKYISPNYMLWYWITTGWDLGPNVPTVSWTSNKSPVIN